MKATSTLAAVAGFLTSAHAQCYSLTAARSGSLIHLSPIQARGFGLWIGGGPSVHYCPTQIERLGDCPNTQITNFAGGQDTLGMGTIVPGGQQVYVDPKYGAIGYTMAHSVTMPNGSITTGWTLSENEYFGILAWENGLLACNTTVGGPWQVYGVIEDVTPPGDCLGFDALTSNMSSPAAWQYI